MAEVVLVMSVLSTHQDSPGQSLSGDHDAGPVFDRRHPAHLAGRRRGLILVSLDGPISLNDPRIDHFLLSLRAEKGISTYASYTTAITPTQTS